MSPSLIRPQSDQRADATTRNDTTTELHIAVAWHRIDLKTAKQLWVMSYQFQCVDKNRRVVRDLYLIARKRKRKHALTCMKKGFYWKKPILRIISLIRNVVSSQGARITQIFWELREAQPRQAIGAVKEVPSSRATYFSRRWGQWRATKERIRYMKFYWNKAKNLSIHYCY